MNKQYWITHLAQLSGVQDEHLYDRAISWMNRYYDADITKMSVTGDGCIYVEYTLDCLPSQCVVFESKRMIMWNTVNNVRKNYRRIEYLT